MSTLSKILFVDDDELISELAIMTMELVGFEIRYCPSGNKALEELQKFDPELILLDVIMPEMDGIETFSNIRKTSGHDQTPIIFMTGRTKQSDRDNYVKMGALGVIDKPFDPNLLGDQISDLWKNR